MKAGCYTALVTPFAGEEVDLNGLRQLLAFQIKNDISGVLAIGTTGESATLTWQEHQTVIEAVVATAKGKCTVLVGTGSNNTKEAIQASKHAAKAGADAVLLVDPYYNGPSSLEIRREYIAPIAEVVSGIEVIPYIIPGRTGCQLLPQDIAILHQKYPNIKTVKEATGNIENMRLTRKYAGKELQILSGDDGMTLEMMTDPSVMACGAISVASNIVPKFITKAIQLFHEGHIDESKALFQKLAPLFSIITVTTTEESSVGPVSCRARNPLAIKTLMAILGMPVGSCRQPLGKMTQNGINAILKVAREVQANSPELFAPIAEFFNVDIENRLNDPKNWQHLFYTNYAE